MLTLAGSSALLLELPHDVFVDPAPLIADLAARGLHVIVVGTAAVFLSLSRGGSTSLLGAGLFIALVIGARRTADARGWVLGLLGLAAFVCLLYLGFDAVYDRLATLQEEDAYDNRWQIVKDIALVWARFPLIGTGLGSHELIYPMFDRSTVTAVAGHAEDEYAQLAEETGMVGLALALAFAVVVMRSFFRCVRGNDRFPQAVAYGLGLGLAAILIHSFSDFGLHLPANACLAAAVCGVLVGLGRQGRASSRDNGQEVVLETRPGLLRKASAALSLAAVLGCGVWALVTAERARSGEAHWKSAVAAEKRVSEQEPPTRPPACWRPWRGSAGGRGIRRPRSAITSGPWPSNTGRSAGVWPGRRAWWPWVAGRRRSTSFASCSASVRRTTPRNGCSPS